MELCQKFGVYLLQKERTDQSVLKDLLQLLKSLTSVRNSSFAYVEARSSLIPELSLWENLQLEADLGSWSELELSGTQEQRQLMALIPDRTKVASAAQDWEKFTVSLLKGLLMPSQNVLIDVNEDLLSPLMIQNFKQIILRSSTQKNLYLASAKTSLWLDCSHSFITRGSHRFNVEALDASAVKKYWAA